MNTKYDRLYQYSSEAQRGYKVIHHPELQEFQERECLTPQDIGENHDQTKQRLLWLYMRHASADHSDKLAAEACLRCVLSHYILSTVMDLKAKYRSHGLGLFEMLPLVLKDTDLSRSILGYAKILLPAKILETYDPERNLNLCAWAKMLTKQALTDVFREHHIYPATREGTLLEFARKTRLEQVLTNSNQFAANDIKIIATQLKVFRRIFERNPQRRGGAYHSPTPAQIKRMAMLFIRLMKSFGFNHVSVQFWILIPADCLANIIALKEFTRMIRVFHRLMKSFCYDDLPIQFWILLPADQLASICLLRQVIDLFNSFASAFNEDLDEIADRLRSYKYSSNLSTRPPDQQEPIEEQALVRVFKYVFGEHAEDRLNECFNMAIDQAIQRLLEGRGKNKLVAIRVFRLYYLQGRNQEEISGELGDNQGNSSKRNQGYYSNLLRNKDRAKDRLEMLLVLEPYVAQESIRFLKTYILEHEEEILTNVSRNRYGELQQNFTHSLQRAEDSYEALTQYITKSKESRDRERHPKLDQDENFFDQLVTYIEEEIKKYRKSIRQNQDIHTSIFINQLHRVTEKHLRKTQQEHSKKSERKSLKKTQRKNVD